MIAASRKIQDPPKDSVAVRKCILTSKKRVGYIPLYVLEFYFEGVGMSCNISLIIMKDFYNESIH